MLYSIDGREITDIPGRRRANFDTWVGNLAPADYDDVRRAINEYVNDNALMQLLESDRIKEKIRNFEQDMWSY